MDPELEMTSGNGWPNLRRCPLSITKTSMMESGCQSAAGLTDFQGWLLSAILYLGYEGSQCFLNALMLSLTAVVRRPLVEGCTGNVH